LHAPLCKVLDHRQRDRDQWFRFEFSPEIVNPDAPVFSNIG
jgi:hypothetical protein